MRTLWISVVFMIQSLLAFGGFGDKAPVKWGKVDPSEFDVRPPAGSQGSHALVLCDYGTIEVTNRSFYTRHTRIRILDEEGMAYGTIEIPYNTSDNHDDFVKLQAQTVLMRDGKPVILPVPRQQIKDVVIDDQWSKKVIVFTDAEPGAIIEYRYTLASLDFERLDEWYFQREIPTLWSEIRFEVPRTFVYLVTFQNNRRLSPEEEVDFGARLQWLYDAGGRTRDLQLAKQDHLLYQTPESRYKVWVMNNFKKKIVMRNMQSLADPDGGMANQDRYAQLRMQLFESYGNMPSMYRPMFVSTIRNYSYRSRWGLMYGSQPSGYVYYRLRTWQEMNDDLLAHERFGLMLMRSTGRTGQGDSLLFPGMTDRERIMAVYDHVRRDYDWNGAYAMYATREMKELLEKRTGASSDLNLLLVNMLRRAGLNADPLLIRTSNLGPPEKMYPVSNQFNHVIAIVYAGDEQILLDATTPPAALTLLNRLDVGTEGWAVSSSRPGWISIYERYEQEVIPYIREREAPQFSL